MLRYYLAALMAAMGLLQLEGRSVFLEAVESYQVGGAAGAWVLAVGLIGGELAAAVGLFTRRRFGAVAAVAVMVVWSALAVQAFARGLVLPNCGCFGRFFVQQLRWWVLLEDAALLAQSAWVLRSMSRQTTDTESSIESSPPNPIGALQ